MFDDYQPLAMYYNVHDFPIELQDISNRIYTSNFSYLLVFFSWHMQNVFGFLLFLLLLVSLMIISPSSTL